MNSENITINELNYPLDFSQIKEFWAIDLDDQYSFRNILQGTNELRIDWLKMDLTNNPCRMMFDVFFCLVMYSLLLTIKLLLPSKKIKMEQQSWSKDKLPTNWFLQIYVKACTSTLPIWWDQIDAAKSILTSRWWVESRPWVTQLLSPIVLGHKCNYILFFSTGKDVEDF